jgi:hypothetical protein
MSLPVQRFFKDAKSAQQPKQKKPSKIKARALPVKKNNPKASQDSDEEYYPSSEAAVDDEGWQFYDSKVWDNNDNAYDTDCDVQPEGVLELVASAQKPISKKRLMQSDGDSDSRSPAQKKKARRFIGDELETPSPASKKARKTSNSSYIDERKPAAIKKATVKTSKSSHIDERKPAAIKKATAKTSKTSHVDGRKPAAKKASSEKTSENYISQHANKIASFFLDNTMGCTLTTVLKMKQFFEKQNYRELLEVEVPTEVEAGFKYVDWLLGSSKIPQVIGEAGAMSATRDLNRLYEGIIQKTNQVREANYVEKSGKVYYGSISEYRRAQIANLQKELAKYSSSCLNYYISWDGTYNVVNTRADELKFYNWALRVLNLDVKSKIASSTQLDYPFDDVVIVEGDHRRKFQDHHRKSFYKRTMHRPSRLVFSFFRRFLFVNVLFNL